MTLQSQPENYELKDATLNGVRGEGCAYTDVSHNDQLICGVFVKASEEDEDLTDVLHKGRVDYEGVHYRPLESNELRTEQICLPVNIQFVTRRGDEERAIFEATGQIAG